VIVCDKERTGIGGVARDRVEIEMGSRRGRPAFVSRVQAKACMSKSKAAPYASNVFL
jgi:hypothetical protein